jgi:hypothetical protein
MTIDAMPIRLPNKRLERTAESATAQPQAVRSTIVLSRLRAVMLVLLLVSLLGSAGAQTPSVGGLRQPDWHEMIRCDTPIVLHRTPMRAEGEIGLLWNEGGGLWPENVQPVIELISRPQPNSRYVVRPKVPAGTFSFTGIPSGEYDFRAGEKTGGWGCISGIVILSARKSANILRIEIPLGR